MDTSSALQTQSLGGKDGTSLPGKLTQLSYLPVLPWPVSLKNYVSSWVAVLFLNVCVAGFMAK